MSKGRRIRRALKSKNLPARKVIFAYSPGVPVIHVQVTSPVCRNGTTGFFTGAKFTVRFALKVKPKHAVAALEKLAALL